MLDETPVTLLFASRRSALQCTRMYLRGVISTLRYLLQQARAVLCMNCLHVSDSYSLVVNLSDRTSVLSKKIRLAEELVFQAEDDDPMSAINCRSCGLYVYPQLGC